MDLEIGHHACFRTKIQLSLDNNVDTSELPLRLLTLPKKDRIALAYQVPPHLEAWGNPNYPYVVAVHEKVKMEILEKIISRKKDENLSTVALCPIDSADEARHIVVQSRLYDGRYVMLGETDMDEEHFDHVYIGVSALEGNILHIARDLGQVMGELHFGQCIDVASFAVVYAHLYQSTVYKLWIVVDWEQCQLLRPSVDPEIVERLAFVLGRLAYIPSPEQISLFRAFSQGYRRSARKYNHLLTAEAVLVYIREFTE